MISHGLLEQAVQRFASVFSGDYELLQSIAHGKQVIQRPVDIAPSVDNAYELRVLTGTDREIAGLLTASVLNVLCPDARQAAQVAKKLRNKGAIWLSPAGGAAQPQYERREALTDVAAYAMEANKNLGLDASVHTGGCANVKRSFSNVAEYYRYVLGGVEGQVQYDGQYERNTMSALAKEIPDALVMKGVDSSRIRVRMSHVGPDNRFTHLEG